MNPDAPVPRIAPIDLTVNILDSCNSDCRRSRCCCWPFRLRNESPDTTEKTMEVAAVIKQPRKRVRVKVRVNKQRTLQL